MRRDREVVSNVEFEVEPWTFQDLVVITVFLHFDFRT